MKVFRELDSVRLLKPVWDLIMGEDRKIEVPAGSRGLVVHVFGSADNPPAYIVEFRLSNDEYVVANVQADNLIADSEP